MNRNHRKLGVLCVVLAALASAFVFAAAPARADLITVHGTTASPWLVEPTYFPRIGASGFTVDVNGTLGFTYGYNSTNEFTLASSFTITSFDAAGTLIDTLDLTPTLVVARELDNYLGATHDEYVAGAQWTVAGQTFQALVDLFDTSGTALPRPPAVYLNQLGLWDDPEFGIGVGDPTCDPNFCEGLLATITSISAVITPDSDGDGVPDANDNCPGSANGPVDAHGCAIDQLVPCAGPAGGGTWRNHGQYMAALAMAANAFLNAGLITQAEKDAIVAAGGSSGCGT